MNRTTGEIFIGTILLVLIGLLWDPFHWLMLMELQMTVLGLAAVMAAFYTGFLIGMVPRDERETQHKAMASQAGFLVGVVGLVAFLIYQLLTTHHLDLFCLGILGAMVLTKVGVQVWARFFR